MSIWKGCQYRNIAKDYARMGTKRKQLPLKCKTHIDPVINERDSDRETRG